VKDNCGFLADSGCSVLRGAAARVPHLSADAAAKRTGREDFSTASARADTAGHTAPQEQSAHFWNVSHAAQPLEVMNRYVLLAAPLLA